MTLLYLPYFFFRNLTACLWSGFVLLWIFWISFHTLLIIITIANCTCISRTMMVWKARILRGRCTNADETTQEKSLPIGPWRTNTSIKSAQISFGYSEASAMSLKGLWELIWSNRMLECPSFRIMWFVWKPLNIPWKSEYVNHNENWH